MRGSGGFMIGSFGPSASDPQTTRARIWELPIVHCWLRKVIKKVTEMFHFHTTRIRLYFNSQIN